MAAVHPVIMVRRSSLGDIPSAQLSRLVQFLLDFFVVPQLNIKGNEGFLIPNMAGVHFVSPSLTMIDGAVVVATDVRYAP